MVGKELKMITRTCMGAGVVIAAAGMLLIPAMAIDLPQPAGGWKANISETEFLCFYDTTTWPLSNRQPGKAVTRPAGCGP
jgi:hypothetical protein